ncbi:hypothetical protein [Ancylobacter defluvii]|uniref:Uncharacterized protein n=1 Tax=Ancylobacter defluvii TaxID=1282440 RepID=A0A9W6JZF3_9HYPH|nr:hypothetical protein [Ancylobacter defluvii]MBS7588318.1 hypothetical protein [Ancylobacter defluvii]GLK86715.1 hypothetical protein GCM10017653_47850 [Ancylobacter defluvii]
MTDTAEDRIEAGEPVHMEFTAEGRRWWLNDPYQEVERAVVRRLGNRLVEAGDSLFGWPGFSQTWRAARDG